MQDNHLEILEEKKIVSLNNLDTFSLFEAFLGNSSGEENIFSFEAILMLDKSEAYPLQQVEALNNWKLNHYFIPQAEGGMLENLQDLMFLTRLLARRDLNCAIAYGGTFLGSIAVWIGGDKALKKQVAGHIMEGKKIAFALTEKSTGGDLLASEVHAEKYGNMFEVTGEKWLYNHALTSNFTTVLAKTDKGCGPRSCSLLFVPTLGEFETNTLPPSIKALDRIHTVGLKGLDLGGVAFYKHLVPGENLIGKAGSGLELSLTGLQVTKLLCSGLSLGSLDTLLRCTTRFCLDRILYKNSILEIPIIRSKLINCFLDLITGEALCLAACRTAQLLSAQFGLLSAITKAFVPSLVEFHTKELASLLGARSYITSETEYTIFQKQARDNSIISIFEGNTYVNYQYALQQMKIIFSLFPGIKPVSPESLKEIYQLNQTLSPVDFGRFSIVGKGRDDLAFGLPCLLGELEKTGSCSNAEGQEIREEIRYIIGRFNKLRDDFIREDPIVNNPFVIQPAVFGYAHKYALFHAVTAATCIIYYNKELLSEKLSWIVLLKVCLKKAACELRGVFFNINEEESKHIMGYILHCNNHSFLFSLFPVKVL